MKFVTINHPMDWFPIGLFAVGMIYIIATHGKGKVKI